MPETVGKIGDDDDGTQGTCTKDNRIFFSLSPSFWDKKTTTKRFRKLLASMLGWVSINARKGRQDKSVYHNFPASYPEGWLEY